MGEPRKFVTNRRTLGFAATAVVLAVAGILVAAACGASPSDLAKAWNALAAWLAGHPVLLVLALAVLPGLPVPSSALLVAAGAVWKDRPALACAIAVAAMAFNILWTYLFAAGPGRRWCARLLAKTGTNLPDLPRNDHVRLILILRLTPGMPFFVQNYLLGLLRPPFRIYLAISIACNAPVVCGLVLGGAGLAGGSLMPFLAGISLVALAVVVTHTIRRRLGKRQPM